MMILSRLHVPLPWKPGGRVYANACVVEKAGRTVVVAVIRGLGTGIQVYLSPTLLTNREKH